MSSSTYSFGVWRTIIALWPKLKVNLYVKVGDDRLIKFWADAWNEQTTLKKSFPNQFIFAIILRILRINVGLQKDGTYPSGSY